MKNLLVILLLISTLSCSAQYWGDPEVKSEENLTPGLYLRKASINLSVGLGMMIAGSAMAVYSADPNVGDMQTAWVISGAIIGAGGIVMQFIGFSQIGKAGKLFDIKKEENISLNISRHGVGLAYKF